MRPPRPRELPHDGYRDRRSPAAEATGASGTRRPWAGRSAARRGPRAPAAASLARAAGDEATPGLEGRQVVVCLDERQAFLSRVHGDGPGAPDGQQPQGPPREGPMPRPARPAPAFVMIEPDRALGGCNTALNGPAGARDPHDLCHSGPVPGEDHRGGPRWGPADAAPDPPPAAPARLHGLCQGLPAPVLPAWPLRPRPGPAP